MGGRPNLPSDKPQHPYRYTLFGITTGLFKAMVCRQVRAALDLGTPNPSAHFCFCAEGGRLICYLLSVIFRRAFGVDAGPGRPRVHRLLRLKFLRRWHGRILAGL